MKIESLIKNIVRAVGVAGIKEVEEAVETLTDKVDDPWKRTVLDLLADAVETYGLEGIEQVQDAVDRIASGHAPDLSFASLKARSDALALMQNAEADDKKKAREFFILVGDALSVILKALVRGLLKG